MKPITPILTPLALTLVLTGVTSGCDGNPKQARETGSTHTSAQVQTDPVVVTEPTPIYGFKVVNTFPHDPLAFTQGLQYVDGLFYEGTGQFGHSTLRKVDIKTGKTFKSVPIESQYFGEGITFLNGKIYQLTWQSQIGFVYDASSFKRIKLFRYPTEGWGLTNDGKRLIMSDGTSFIMFWDPETLKEIGKISVTDQGAPIANLNELEYINGEIYANVWQTDRIARIDPASGKVKSWIDLTGLLRPEDIPSGHIPEVLNGIAYDEKGDRLFVTGKFWPKVYEIKLAKKT